MTRYTIRVRIGSSFQDLPFVAESTFFACQQAEAQYGQGSVLGIINEEHIG